MYIRSETDDTPDCPTTYLLCAPALSAGPALPNLPAQDAAQTPVPQSALAASIQHLGKRNFVGIVVIAVLVFVGLVLWLSFGRWPRDRMRRMRERLKRGDKLPRSGSGMPSNCEEHEHEQGQGHWQGREGRAAADFGDRVRMNLDERDEKPDAQRGVREDGLCSPRSVEIEVDSLEEAEEPRPKRVPRVHFA
ncbi:hypothetical protein C8Q78DRAFT_1079865 [Trametes maxima]|nr:hypothetical protein C8Q78DRAFT_1079865 [Trametes maxima]